MKLTITLVLCMLASQPLFSQHITGLTILHDGETRVYDMYIPVDYSLQERLPLILDMHGLGASSQSQAAYSEFPAIADTARFIVVYPQGLERTIDTGQTGTHWNAYFGTDVDDKGFLLKLIDKMIADYNIDESMVYATGWSNGGYMAYRLACETSERIAAVASVDGTMVFQQLPNCNPSNPVSVLHIHGTDDNTVNYNGSSRSVGVPEVIMTWLDFNSCKTDGIIEQNLPDIDQTDNSTVSRYQYDDCALRTSTHLYKVSGGGHTWPGATQKRPELGTTNNDIKASAVIWNFFREHRNANAITDAQDEIAEKIFVYPSVFSDLVNINRLPVGAMISLYSYSGKLVMRKTATKSQERFDTPTLTPGIYIVHVQLSGNDYASFRIVKDH